MLKKLRSRRGVTIEMGIFMMLAVFAMCGVVVTLSLFIRTQILKKASAVTTEYEVDCVGEAFIHSFRTHYGTIGGETYENVNVPESRAAIADFFSTLTGDDVTVDDSDETSDVDRYYDEETGRTYAVRMRRFGDEWSFTLKITSPGKTLLFLQIYPDGSVIRWIHSAE